MNWGLYYHQRYLSLNNRVLLGKIITTGQLTEMETSNCINKNVNDNIHIGVKSDSTHRHHIYNQYSISRRIIYVHLQVLSCKQQTIALISTIYIVRHIYYQRKDITPMFYPQLQQHIILLHVYVTRAQSKARLEPTIKHRLPLGDLHINLAKYTHILETIQNKIL